ncbi:hypothetical protein [Hyalangium minutum]|uniref:Uncharacterized protein n=1 Tax=Hyalangium minutum TaxID=394096 RepID=A0A085WNF7_9BACT|nr:hypothetical protein [Hyalangium minutum]KFE69220.1 hypothetical protein DB31_7122 [Hyalangium minutum]
MLRTSSPEDESLASRVQGQLSDLPVVLRVSPGPSLGTSDAEQWRSAVELARSESARVAIWFSHETEAIVVSIAEPSTQHLFVRRIQADGAGGRLGHSALAEAAALAVRSAVKALEAGHEVGVIVEPPPEPPSAPPPEAPPPVSPPPSPPAPSSPVREGSWVLDLGWQAAVDGSSPRGQQGPRLGIAREGSTWRARAQLLASLQAQLSDAYTRVSLSRHSVIVGAGVCSKPTERLRLGADLGVGLSGFRRSTVALASEVSAVPPRLTLAPFVSPELSARWRAGAVALEASISVDVLAGVPTLGYQRGEEFIPRNTLWWAQPRLGLAILVGSP